MIHPLDRPAWSALSARQASFGLGDERARRFAPDFGLFAGAADGSAEAQAALAALVAAYGPVATVETAVQPLPPGLAATSQPAVLQMVAERLSPREPAFEVTALSNADAPQMLALAVLTRPGPFFARTHQLGDFVGVKQDGELIAMAGERMKPIGFTEVSGVCTHPDHQGKGYAAGLMAVVEAGILARGETPFLHVFAQNTGAVRLYKALGYTVRTEMNFTVLSQS
ncbi:MAG: GNAT family N-acetyltransferase [Phenylobacterium sp.]|nr:MAG: GNAT family N-acetyltransferase [Phenylobacterium sp.]